jgi:hypothetical protein
MSSLVFGAAFRAAVFRVVVLGLCCLAVAGKTGALSAAEPVAPVDPDWRNIRNGTRIPGGHYCDQPYVVQTDDGAWLCVMTSAQGAEGSPTQTVLSMRSTDEGKTWSTPIPLEAPGSPETSYAVLLKVPSGRVYCFYNHNTANLREVKTEDGKSFKRVDSLGDFVFRYTDDHGRSWSAQRTVVPVREFACDRNNVYGGKVRFFWNVGRTLVIRGDDARRPLWKGGEAAIIPLHKVGAMGTGFFAQSEGAFLKSSNILTETDPAKITFETLPDGDQGLRTPPGGGRVSEEHSLVQLSDGSLYTVYRSIDGHPVSAYSRDGGHTWSEPQYKTYSPAGRRFKHPRAATFVWKLANGRYLYWFHNHSPTPEVRKTGWDPYEDRNPVWVSVGEEVDSPAGKQLAWSQPEVLLYDPDPYLRISYPDLIETPGGLFITETQKATGRVHRIDSAFLSGLLSEPAGRGVARLGITAELSRKDVSGEATLALPKLPAFVVRGRHEESMPTRDLRAGFSVELVFRGVATDGPRQLLSNRTPLGEGLRITAEPDGSVRLVMHDGRSEQAWSSDRGLLSAERDTHVVIVVDGGPKVITFVVNGVLSDGGTERQFGWGRFSPDFRGPAGLPNLTVGAGVSLVRVYNRALKTFEAVGNHLAVSPR